jgi:hypothetical protein
VKTASSAKPACHSAVGAQSRCAQGLARSERAQQDCAPTSRNKSLSLWLCVAGAFLLLGLVWGVLFTVAHGAKVQSVPLATKGGRP